jgi:hypothetical protein
VTSKYCLEIFSPRIERQNKFMQQRHTRTALTRQTVVDGRPAIEQGSRRQQPTRGCLRRALPLEPSTRLRRGLSQAGEAATRGRDEHLGHLLDRAWFFHF